MLLPRLAALALLGCLAGCATDAATGKNPTIPSTAKASQLRPGDNLTVAILGVPDPSTNIVQVDEQGFIDLPYIGAVKAAGATTSALTKLVHDEYISKKYYTTVEIAATVTERYVYVGGEVVKPGRIVWTGDLTAAKAVQAAGGFTLYAKEEKVTLVRNEVIYDVDIRVAQKNPAEDPRLEPGDSIQVPRTSF